MEDERFAHCLPFCIFHSSAYFFGKGDHRHAHGASFAPSLDISRETCTLSSDLRVETFFPALWAHPSRHALDDDERSPNPEVLLDLSLLHLLAADVTFTVIV